MATKTIRESYKLKDENNFLNYMCTFLKYFNHIFYKSLHLKHLSLYSYSSSDLSFLLLVWCIILESTFAALKEFKN